MKVGSYDEKIIEPKILEFWSRNQIYAKVREKTKGRENFYFLDGPPYTSGVIHLGTAWNKTIKDALLRYKRMRGFNVWDKAGYDMHGLPTEHATEKRLGISGKTEILKLGIDKFVEACRHLAQTNLQKMTEDFKRLGVWMDFEDPYMTATDDYIESEWWLIKKAHEQGRLYEGLRTMPWCASCTTACAKHELEYKTVEEDSIFVKFKLAGRDNEYLIIWTTTPWTIPFNLAVMANPEIKYVKIKVDNEYWHLAKALAGAFIQGVVNKKLEIVKEISGEDMKGWAYEHPFEAEIPAYAKMKTEHPNIHTVVLSPEYVDTTAGSGLVHCAPGCGPEDYEVGYANDIPAYNTLDEHGIFPDFMGKFSGLKAKKDDNQFIKALEETGALIAVAKVDHEYAHCQRCHKPVIFRATKQWFFKIEDLKEKMVKGNNKIKWIPRSAYNAFDAWLRNLRDNSITKQRFWGCPVPIWRCSKCRAYDVIGSIKELKKKAGRLPKDLHRPWIDGIIIPCECGEHKERLPDVVDVWVDAGIASWTCLSYPQKKMLFNRFFPADFILEGKDQIRGWFNLLMVASMIAFEKPPFKSVYMHGFVQDALGRKMAKSLGNYILPDEVVTEYGADTFRYFFIGNSTPGEDINYNKEDVKLKYKNLTVLWNLHNYLIDLCKTNKFNPAEADLALCCKVFSNEERHILSRLHSTIKKCTGLFDSYLIESVPNEAEKLYLDLSRTYIQLIREKASIGEKLEKEAACWVIYKTMLEALKLLAPTCPFITEEIYQNMKSAFGLEEKSIHLCSWPDYDEKQIDGELELGVDIAQSIVQPALSLREKIQLNVRWPIKKLYIVTKRETVAKTCRMLGDIIKNQLNVKGIEVLPMLKEIKLEVKADFSKLKDLKPLAPQIIAKMATDSPQNIIDKIDREGKYSMVVDNKKIELKRDQLIVKRAEPPHLVGGEFRGGFIYLDKTRTDELEAEGYAREATRRVQAQRKKAGLEKRQKISLFITADEELVSMLRGWKKQIQEKVGAGQINISTNLPAKAHKRSSEEKIKQHKFTIFFDLIA